MFHQTVKGRLQWVVPSWGHPHWGRGTGAGWAIAWSLDASLYFYLFIYLFYFLGLHLQHVEVLRLGIESKLQPLAYATATAMPDPSHGCDLHHSSQQCQILSPLSEVSCGTGNLMVPSRIHFHCTTMGAP